MENLAKSARAFLETKRLSIHQSANLEGLIIETLSQHVTHADLTITQLSSLIGINERTLNKCCIEYLGQSPSALIKSVRLHLVEQLKLQGFNELQAIEKCGFRTARQFKSAKQVSKK